MLDYCRIDQNPFMMQAHHDFFLAKISKLSGLKRKAQHTMKFVKEKNEFLTRINSSYNHCTKDSLATLLENDYGRLWISCCGESRIRKSQTIKKANHQFLKGPSQSGKNVLDPIRAIQLQYNQSLLDIFSQLSLDFFRWIASCFNNFESLQLHLCQLLDLIPILNTRRNARSPGINMFLYKFYKNCP